MKSYKFFKFFEGFDIFVFIQKQYPESFAFLFPRTAKLFACEVCKCLKKWANF